LIQLGQLSWIKILSAPLIPVGLKEVSFGMKARDRKARVKPNK
jgi:hypothetical protein